MLPPNRGRPLDPTREVTAAQAQTPSQQGQGETSIHPDSIAGNAATHAAEIPITDGEAIFKRGDLLGRYMVVDRLGSGGMGVVYAAYDPELDRKLAIKLLRPELPDGKAAKTSSRMLREAQALARLSHQNVISVFDIGTLDGQVFIAMEYIEGHTLKEWLSEKPRPWREVLAVFVQAGRGLAAAHAAGLVHRDFKPANVLLASDGRVKVLDFGLARAGQDVDAEKSLPDDVLADTALSPRTGALASPLTRTGAFLGTPGYMSPEQLKGLHVDARTDQFSFCAAMYQALYQELPFAGDTVEERVSAIQRGAIAPARSTSHVPQWLRETLLKGLRADPDQRHPSMTALLEILERRVDKMRRRVPAVATVLLLFGAAAWGAVQLKSQRQQICKGEEGRLAGIWDEGRRKAIETAFIGTGKPFAADAVRGVTRLFDDYARRWALMQTEACEATRIRGEQSEELLDLRSGCLSHRLQELKALADIYASADEKVVAKAVEATQGLSDLDACANVELLRAPVKPPADAPTRAKVEELRGRLSTIKAMLESGKYSDALPLAQGAVKEAEELRYDPLTAEALFQAGQAQSLTGDYRDAEATLSNAVLVAESGRHDEVAIRSGARLVWLAATVAKYEQGEAWAKHASALIKRLGGNDKLSATLQNNLGTLYKNQGRYDEALQNHQRALAAAERLDDDRALASILNNIGVLMRRQGKYSEALPYYQRALAIKERTLGASHPDLGSTLINMGVLMRLESKYDEALSYFEKSLNIKERALGSTHPLLVLNLQNIADVLRLQEKYETSISTFERALQLSEKAHGPRHPDVAYVLTGLGQAYLGSGKVQLAIETLQRAITIQESRQGEPSFLGEARFGLARAFAAKGEPTRARMVAEKAREAFIAAGEGSKKDALDVEHWLATHH